MDYLFLWLYALIWLFVLLIVLRKYSINNIGSAYVLFYSILCILALHIFYNDEIFKRFNGQSFISLVYLLVFLILFIRPLLKLDKICPVLVHPSGRIMPVIYIVVIVFSLLGLPEIISNFISGLVMLATDEGYGQQLYHELRNSDAMVGNASHSVISYISVVSNFARGLAPFLFLYYLSTKKINSILFIGLFLSTFISFMSSISSGSRSAILTLALNIFFMYLFMRKYYSHRILRVFKPLLIGAASVIGAAFLFLTVSRTTTIGEGPIFFAERYAAQSILEFGKNGLDPGGCRYGDRTFPLIKSIFTKDVARDYYSRLNKYQNLKTDESSFITFVGDFTVDYGPIGGAVVMLLMISFFSISLKRKHTIGLQHLALVYLLIMILNGFYLYPLPDFLGNILFFTYIFLFFFFSFTRYGKITKHSEYSYPSANI